MTKKIIPFTLTLGTLLLIVSLAKLPITAMLLQVLATAVGMFTGLEFNYIAGQGYYSPAVQVLINDSCSGFNYLIISLGTFSYLAYSRHINMLHPWPWLAVACVSLLLTLLANVGRISFCIWLIKLFPSYPALGNALVHQCLGIVCYFGFLISLIALWHFTYKKINHDTQTPVAAA